MPSHTCVESVSVGHTSQVARSNSQLLELVVDIPVMVLIVILSNGSRGRDNFKMKFIYLEECGNKLPSIC